MPTSVPYAEYEKCIAILGANLTDENIIQALKSDHAWTSDGARAILMLARQFGTAILRNSLALAAAMGIEDGASGL